MTLGKWGSDIEIERRNRIRLCVACYAYEFGFDQTMTDVAWDALAKSIRPNMMTGHRVMDKFFREEFKDYTGQWIHAHPELDGIARLYQNHYLNKVENKQ